MAAGVGVSGDAAASMDVGAGTALVDADDALLGVVAGTARGVAGPASLSMSMSMSLSLTPFTPSPVLALRACSCFPAPAPAPAPPLRSHWRCAHGRHPHRVCVPPFVPFPSVPPTCSCVRSALPRTAFQAARAHRKLVRARHRRRQEARARARERRRTRRGVDRQRERGM
ncbi:hypothetical protein B0H14DRAFT_2691038, partial [Mycena olivaceomarginata]